MDIEQTPVPVVADLQVVTLAQERLAQRDQVVRVEFLRPVHLHRNNVMHLQPGPTPAGGAGWVQGQIAIPQALPVRRTLDQGLAREQVQE